MDQNKNTNNDFENNDLFSYDNSGNISSNSGSSFDLNSFSTKAFEESAKTKKVRKTKKRGSGRFLKVMLSLFLVGLITASLVVGCFMFYAFTMVDGTMEEDLENSLNYTTTIYVTDNGSDYKEYRRLHGQYNRIWVDYLNPEHVELPEDYEGIPQMLAIAFVAIEDKRFFDHDGVDWQRTISAFAN